LKRKYAYQVDAPMHRKTTIDCDDKNSLLNRIAEHKKEAFEQAIDSLSRYKFMMFGYWSAIWVHLNQIDKEKEVNPFRMLVEVAREIQHKGK
jgi:hypothetical protein